jgi:hypothetical protein
MKTMFLGLLLAANIPATAFSASEQKAAAGQDEVVCQRSKVTETRTKTQKTCRTRAEWTRIGDETRRKFQEDAQNGAAKINFQKAE